MERCRIYSSQPGGLGNVCRNMNKERFHAFAYFLVRETLRKQGQRNDKCGLSLPINEMKSDLIMILKERIVGILS